MARRRCCVQMTFALWQFPKFVRDVQECFGSIGASHVVMDSESLSGVHQQVLEDRAEAQSREESERADDHDDGDQQRGEERRGDGKSAE